MLPNGHRAWIVARDGSSLATATRLHFECGGYESEASARDAGERVRLHLRILSAILQLGLEVPVSDRVDGQLSDSVKSKLAPDQRAKLLDCVHGLLVFPDDGEHAEITMHGQLGVNPSDSQYWLAGFEQLWDTDIKLTEGANAAIELLAMAGSEASPRNAFLVSYLALESLVARNRRPAASQALLDEMLELAQEAARHDPDAIPQNEVNALRSAIANLRRESLASALMRIADQNPTAEIRGMTLRDLLRRCTRARNKTAHPSSSVPEDEYRTLIPSLRELVSSLVWTACRLPPFRLDRPGDSISLEANDLEARVITYPRR